MYKRQAEDTKGTPIYREAHQKLKANPCIHFVGNIEPRYIMDLSLIHI